MKGQKIRNVIRCFAFILIFCVLLYGVNGLLAEKWWYPMFNESPAYQYKELYETDLSDLQAVFLGTSHIEMAVDPMLIYKEKGFVTFNMASSSQPMEGSYYALEEVFRLSNPKYVFFDVSKLFTSSGRSSHRMIFENMQWGLPKLKYIKRWAMLADEEYRLQRLISAFFPILEYHDRWENLTEQDFVNEAGKRQYYRKGYYSRALIESNGIITTDWLNEIADQKYLVEVYNTAIESGEETTEKGKLSYLYKPEIYANDQELLMKIAELCKKHNARLILVKIPSIRPPQQYIGAWTRIKSEVVKDFAQRVNLDYIDLMYDYDLGLEWKNDTSDNGIHLNYTGAQKATRFFEEYLEKLGLDRIENKAYEDDLYIYDKVCSIAELQSVKGFDEYFQIIQKMPSISVFISARDDMQRHLSQDDINIIQKFGIHLKLEDLKYNDALTLVIDNGETVYEEWSNGIIDHEGTLSDGTPYQVVSSGYLAEDKSEILINNINYSSNKRGINIVVFDHESGLVIDSCTFDTWATDKPEASRTLSTYHHLFRNYEEWCMYQGYNQEH